MFKHDKLTSTTGLLLGFVSLTGYAFFLTGIVHGDPNYAVGGGVPFGLGVLGLIWLLQSS